MKCIFTTSNYSWARRHTSPFGIQFADQLRILRVGDGPLGHLLGLLLSVLMGRLSDSITRVNAFRIAVIFAAICPACMLAGLTATSPTTVVSVSSTIEVKPPGGMLPTTQLNVVTWPDGGWIVQPFGELVIRPEPIKLPFNSTLEADC